MSHEAARCPVQWKLSSLARRAKWFGWSSLLRRRKDRTPHSFVFWLKGEWMKWSALLRREKNRPTSCCATSQARNLLGNASGRSVRRCCTVSDDPTSCCTTCKTPSPRRILTKKTCGGLISRILKNTRKHKVNIVSLKREN